MSKLTNHHEKETSLSSQELTQVKYACTKIITDLGAIFDVGDKRGKVLIALVLDSVHGSFYKTFMTKDTLEDIQ